MNRDDLINYVVKIRRDLHQYPELSGKEVRTRRRICEELDELNIPYDIVEGKNIIARIVNGDGGEIALRADFDALPIHEDVNVLWRSNNSGVMHACGHDGHTSSLLGTAKLLLDHIGEWSGKVYLCFQHGEEIGAGACECVNYLKENTQTKAVLGAHLMSIIPTGSVILPTGLTAAGAFAFKIHIKGKGGHSGRPDLASSAAEIMCDIYQNIIKIPSNHHEAASTCIICPCMLHSGEKANIIPEFAEIEGTARFMGSDACETLMDRIRSTSELTAALHGGTVALEFEVLAKYPIINDTTVAEIGRKAAERVNLKILEAPPTTASDNFAEFLHEFPGFYCFVGSKSERVGTSGVHHAANFDLDESAIVNISELFYETVKSLNANNKLR